MLNHPMLSVVPEGSSSSGWGTQGTPGPLCHDLQQVSGLCASSLSLWINTTGRWTTVEATEELEGHLSCNFRPPVLMGWGWTLVCWVLLLCPQLAQVCAPILPSPSVLQMCMCLGPYGSWSLPGNLQHARCGCRYALFRSTASKLGGSGSAFPQGLGQRGRLGGVLLCATQAGPKGKKQIVWTPGRIALREPRRLQREVQV